MKTRQERIDHHRDYCVHYSPRPGKIGCNYCSGGMDTNLIQNIPVTTRSGSVLKFGPCIYGHTLEDPLKHCPKWERRSIESGEKFADSVEKAMKRMEIAEPFITEWRNRKPIGKSEVVTCPACSGKLHLSQSSYNGHIQAKCETEDCINFIE